MAIRRLIGGQVLAVSLLVVATATATATPAAAAPATRQSHLRGAATAAPGSHIEQIQTVSLLSAPR